MSHPFDGIAEKLKRSREHIANLQVESDRFFEERGYATLPQSDVYLLLNALQDLEQQTVPLRFSILVGEIAHHLRSCLDHLVWQFSSSSYQSGKKSRFIEFPILEARPGKENLFTSYERKIEGITNSKIRELIEWLQPYHAPNPLQHPLLILRNMDITDKHKELVLCLSGGGILVPPEIVEQSILGYKQGILTEAEGQKQMKDNAHFVPSIAIRDSAQGQPEALLPIIAEMQNFVVGVVQQFDRLLPR